VTAVDAKSGFAARTTVPSAKAGSTTSRALPARERQQAQPVPSSRAEAEHGVAPEGIHPFQPLVRVLLADRSPGVVVLVCGTRHRALRQPELLGLVVGHEQQHLRAVRQHGVLGEVLHPDPPTADRTGCGPWVPGVDDPHLGGVTARGPEQHHAARARRPDVQLEPLVGLAEHQHVIGHGRADGMPPHLVRPVRGVDDRVEEVARVGAPGTSVVGARHLVGQVRPARDVAEPQRVDLVTGPVHGVGQQPAVGADQGHAQLEVAGVVAERIVVEHQPPPPEPSEMTAFVTGSVVVTGAVR
jgi:hypothetical protein